LSISPQQTGIGRNIAFRISACKVIHPSVQECLPPGYVTCGHCHMGVHRSTDKPQIFDARRMKSCCRQCLAPKCPAPLCPIHHCFYYHYISESNWRNFNCGWRFDDAVKASYEIM